MFNVKVNNEINLTYPDGFTEMGEAELTRYFGTPDNRWGAYDASQHIILSVSWAKASFVKTMGDPDVYLSGVEARLRKSLVNYQRISAFKTNIASKKDNANGIRFEHRVKDSVHIHVVDLIVFKYKKKYYSVYYITRKNNAAAVRPAFQEVLQSITLG